MKQTIKTQLYKNNDSLSYIFQPHGLTMSDKTMCPEVDSASENEYQGFLLG